MLDRFLCLRPLGGQIGGVLGITILGAGDLALHLSMRARPKA
jgi:hypothetical protein